MSTAYLGLGSNLGDRAANLLRAIAILMKNGFQLTKASSVYESEPADLPAALLNQPQFLNMVIEVSQPSLDPFSLLDECLSIEKQLGRTRSIEKSARTIDIDLLILDDLVIDDVRGNTRLTLPHPRMEFRRFVLEPLAELAPDLRHPVTRSTVRELLSRVEDNSSVKIYGS